MKLLITFITMFFCIASPAAHAQTKEAVRYTAQSEDLRKEVWSWKDPQFKIREVPAEYANASKVVLARRTLLTADSKSKFQFNVFSFNINKEQTLVEIVRELIKLNDKNAVTEYSELSFTQFKKTSGFYSFEKTTSYVGIRVIKPNGNIKEINADDIVLTKDASSEKRAKVAIPDLQPGDMLDYFIATEQQLTNDMSEKPFRVLLFDDAPVLNLSFHAQLGKKYAIDYRSYNGAPELKVGKDDEDEIVVDVIKKNIPPFETSLWVAPGMELPFIRMNISLGARGLLTKYMGVSKPGEVSKNKSSEEIIQDKAKSMSQSYYDGYWMKAAKAEYDAIESDAKKKAKQAGISFKDLSDEEKAAQLFYTIRFTKLLDFDINQLQEKINIGDKRFNGLAFPLFCTMKAAGLHPSILVTNDRSGYRLSELLDEEDLTTTAYLQDTKKFFSIQSIYDVPFTVPSEIEGLTHNKSFTFDHPGAILSLSKTQNLTNVENGPNVPASASSANAHIENLKLSLTPDKNNLAVNRSTTLKGFYKTDAQTQLILYEDFYESERKALNEKKTLMEQLEDGRKSKKYIDEVKNAFAEARKKQKNSFESEAKEWFEQEISDLKNYKTDTLGVRHTAPNFVYSSSFNMSGLVKKAGNNIIVEIGKIQGQPLAIKDAQRKRDIDVYMPFARSIEYNIELQIPEGYTAEGVAALNKNVTNETGLFTVEASNTAKTVTVKIKKHYLHNFEAASKWGKILSFTDAANDWVNAKILLKKI